MILNTWTGWQRFLHFFFMVILLPAGLSQDWKTYPYQEEGAVLTFPDDEGWHPEESIEWWYTNAHLTGQTTGDTYTMMLTYFYYDSLNFDGFRIFNLSNETTGIFRDETLPVNYSVLAKDHLEIVAQVPGINIIESWMTKRDENDDLVPFEYHISAKGSVGAVELDYKAVKRPLMVGGTGYMEQGADGYTYYYSLTGIEVSGTITFGNVTEQVKGFAWVDRQYGATNPLVTREPWEWFSIQLSNGMDLNVWELFTEDRQVPDDLAFRFISAYIDETTAMTTGDFQLERLGYEAVPGTTTIYARKWRLTSDDPEIDLVITTRSSEKEVKLPITFYEGATIIEGTVEGEEVSGVGFAELLHRYENPVIELQVPSEDEPWTPETPVSWELKNPDHGRPVYYDLAISPDNPENYETIAEGITQTQLIWDNADLPADSIYWFRVTGYSVDGALKGVDERLVRVDQVNFIPGLHPLAAAVRLYPNPAVDKVLVALPQDWPGEVVLQLTDISGRLLKTARYENPSDQLSFTLPDLESGMYLMEISSGDLLVTRRVVVDRRR